MSTNDIQKRLKDKKKEEIVRVAYAKKINNQYELLKKWDKGQISGLECIEGIENEGKLFRVDSDLILFTKNEHRGNPNG